MCYGNPLSSTAVQSRDHVHRGQLGFYKLTLAFTLCCYLAHCVWLLMPFPIGSGSELQYKHFNAQGIHLSTSAQGSQWGC